MKRLGFILLGWLIPGGAYLARRRYAQFAGFALAVTAAFGAGLLLEGNVAWPQPAELAGLDGATALVFRAGALSKALAGVPWLLGNHFGTGSFVSGRVHEFGNTLLMMSGVLNVLAISSAMDLDRVEERN